MDQDGNVTLSDFTKIQHEDPQVTMEDGVMVPRKLLEVLGAALLQVKDVAGDKMPTPIVQSTIRTTTP